MADQVWPSIIWAPQAWLESIDLDGCNLLLRPLPLDFGAKALLDRRLWSNGSVWRRYALQAPEFALLGACLHHGAPIGVAISAPATTARTS
jgi:hypothetical protein